MPDHRVPPMPDPITPGSPHDQMRPSPDRLRRLADHLADDGDAEMADLVRRAADEIEQLRSAAPSSVTRP